MNERWKKEILHLLLDKYERTAAYQKGELPDRRVMLRFYDSGKTDFSAYDIDNHFVRTEINETVIAMQAAHWIDFEWMRGEERHIIRRVWLDFSNIKAVYRAAQRQSASSLPCLSFKNWSRKFRRSAPIGSSPITAKPKRILKQKTV